MGLRHRQEGPYQVDLKTYKREALFPGNVIWSASVGRLAEEEGEVGGACVFDEVSVVYLKDANAIQIWLQCAGCLHIPHSSPQASG